MTSDCAPHGCNRARRQSHIYRRPQTSIPITPLPISTAALWYETVIALPLITRCIGIRSCRCRPARPYHKAARGRLFAIPTYDSGNRRSQARWHTAELTTFAMTARLRSRGRSVSQTTPSELWPQTLKPRPRYRCVRSRGNGYRSAGRKPLKFDRDATIRSHLIAKPKFYNIKKSNQSWNFIKG